MMFEEKISEAARGRPELEKLMGHLRRDDVLVVARLDRLARSTIDLLHIAERIKEKQAGLQSLDEPCADTTSAVRRNDHYRLRRDSPVREISDLEADKRGEKGGDGARCSILSPEENAPRSGGARSPTRVRGQIYQFRRKDLQRPPSNHLSLHRAERLLMTLFCSAQPHDPQSGLRPLHARSGRPALSPRPSDPGGDG